MNNNKKYFCVMILIIAFIFSNFCLFSQATSSEVEQKLTGIWKVVFDSDNTFGTSEEAFNFLNSIDYAAKVNSDNTIIFGKYTDNEFTESTELGLESCSFSINDGIVNFQYKTTTLDTVYNATLEFTFEADDKVVAVLKSTDEPGREDKIDVLKMYAVKQD